VQCDGLQVSITVSLADALRNFRHPSEPRLLWADALCINQKDDQEEGHQVKRMGEVYANAKCVLVWLGCDVSNVAEDTFALICEANTHFGDSLVKAGKKVSRMELFEEPYPISIDQDRWSGVVRLLRISMVQTSMDCSGSRCRRRMSHALGFSQRRHRRCTGDMCVA
jgi:hypothetical protein